MYAICKRILQQKKGQSVVELALILPMILLLLLGVVEFGRIFHTYLVLTQGSREGARLAVVGQPDSAIMTKVERVVDVLDAEELEIQISPGEQERIRGEAVEVTARYHLKLIFPNFDLFPNPLPISATTVMRME